MQKLSLPIAILTVAMHSALAMEPDRPTAPTPEQPTSQGRELSLWVQPEIVAPPAVPHDNQRFSVRALWPEINRMYARHANPFQFFDLDAQSEHEDEIGQLLREINELPPVPDPFSGEFWQGDWLVAPGIIARLSQAHVQQVNNNANEPLASQGLAPEIVREMARHADLPQTVALDTFPGRNPSPYEMWQWQLRRAQILASPRPPQPARQHIHKEIAADELCGICLEALDGEQVWVCIDPCDHHYHQACIQQWQKEPRSAAKTCPNCREGIKKLVNQEGSK